MAGRCSRRVAQPEALQLAGFGAWQNAPELDRARVFVRRNGLFDEVLQLLPQAGICLGTEERVRMTQVLVTTDLDTHRPIAIPGDMRDAMSAFQAE